MELTKVQLGAVVEIDEKHARKVIRMFNDLLDSLPGRIANVEVLERTAKVEGNSPTRTTAKCKQAPFIRAGRVKARTPRR